MDERKKNYLVDEICKNVISCDFRESFRGEYLEYFPGRSDRWDVTFKMRPYKSVRKNDFISVANRFIRYYKSVKYFGKLRDEAIKLLGNVGKDGVLNVSGFDYDRDLLVYYYLRCFERLGYFAFYGDDWDGEKLGGIFRKFGLLVEREVYLSKKEMDGVLFWANCEKGVYRGSVEKGKVLVYFIDKGNDYDIERILEEVRLNFGEKKFDYGEGYDNVINYAGVIFSGSTIEYFREVDMRRFLRIQNGAGKLLLLGTRNYFVKNFEEMDLERMLYFSSIIFYLYGLRRPSDIDITCYDRPMPTGNLLKFFEEYGTTGRELLGVGDVSVRGYGNWVVGGKKEYLGGWFGRDWPNYFGADGYEDMVYNPRYHLRIMGMKILVMRADLERRRRRYRPAAYADLLGYNFFMRKKVEILPPPEVFNVHGKEECYDTKKKKDALVGKIQFYLKIKFGIKMDKIQISKNIGI